MTNAEDQHGGVSLRRRQRCLSSAFFRSPPAPLNRDEVRYRPGPLASRQQAGARSDRSHQSSDRRSRRNQPLSGQSAWLRHRPHQPASLRRGRYLQHAGVVLATPVPRAGIVNTGFAFPSYDVVEGDGQRVRLPCQERDRSGRRAARLQGLEQRFSPALTSTAREIHTPEDFKGFKMRVPAAPILTSLFQALGWLRSDAHQFQRTLFCVAN